MNGQEIDLSAVTGGAELAEASGVDHAELLVGFAEALIERDESALASLRGEISTALGDIGLRETASVASNFQRMVRIADATGIPQEAPIMALGDDLIDELDLRSFETAANTPVTSGLQRFIGRLVRPFAPALMQRAANRLAKRKANAPPA